MARDTITLALTGNVRAREFAIAVDGLFHLVEALTKDIAKDDTIEWVVEGLEKGSAIATFRGISETHDARFGIQDVVDAYEDVGKRLSSQSPLTGFSHAVKSHAERIVSVINGHIPSVRFETERGDAEVFEPTTKVHDIVNYGAVRGRIQSLSNRGKLRFTIYDILTDRAVSCYLLQGSEDMMREVWGRLAIVEGLVRRDPITGFPTTVRRITNVRTYDDVSPKSYRDAVGAARGRLGTATPEQVIRRGRDG